MLKKSSDFFGLTNSEVVILGGIKYEPLSDHPVIKICEWGPWGKGSFTFFVLCENLLHD